MVLRYLLSLVLAACLCSCSDSKPPPNPLAPFSGSIPPSATWELLYGSNSPPALTPSNGTWFFDFPQCAQATQCSVNYMMTRLRARLVPSQSITMTFKITALSELSDQPVFDFRTCVEGMKNCSPNECVSPDWPPGQPGKVNLILEREGDNLASPYGRFFAQDDAVILAPGEFSVTVPLDWSRWAPVEGPRNAVAFGELIADLGYIGAGFGGGCFAAHGVAVTSLGQGARFILTGYSIL